MGRRNGKCQWCNIPQKMTNHHVKNRLGDKEEYYNKNHDLDYVTMWVCRKCHNEIEDDYILTGRVIPFEPFVRENTLEGIENNLPWRMEDTKSKKAVKRTRKWIIKKIGKVHSRLYYDRSTKVGLYYTQEKNREKYRFLIMKLAISLNDLRFIYSTV